jgi:hypothetical protein
VYNFIRSPTWITPEFSQVLASEGRETKFSDEQIQRFKSDKRYFLEYRKMVQNTGSSNFPTFYKGSPRQKEAFKKFSGMMKERLNNNEDVSAHLIPNFEVGCRRWAHAKFRLHAHVDI